MQNLSGGRIDDFILRERAMCNFLLSLDIGDLQRGGVFIPQRRMICNLPLFILFYIENLQRGSGFSFPGKARIVISGNPFTLEISKEVLEMNRKQFFSILALSSLSFGIKAGEIRVLTIGNSFSDSVFRYLPQVAESAGDKIIMDRVSIGGCPLNKHWELVEESEKDPTFKPYSKKFSLKDKLLSDKWNFVTIQQASHLSWQPESYHPYAKLLQDYVKRHAPGAEIVMQQTWAYRFDDPRLQTWKIDQRTMFERLVKAYDQAAAELGIRLIPTGEAVQRARETQPVKYVPYSPEAVKNLKYPDPLPSEAGSFVIGMSWFQTRDEKSGESRWLLRNDPSHLNRRGEYLQACLWYSFLFNKPTSEIKFVPEEITPEDAAFLRDVAQQTLDARRTGK